MDEKARDTKRPWFLHSLKYFLILVAGLGGGAALIYSLQPPKLPPPQLVYHIMLLDSEAPISDFKPIVAGRTSGALGYTLVTSPRVPATLNALFPAMIGTGQSGNAPRLDVVGELTQGRVNTDLTLYIRGLKSIQHLSTKDGETHVVELTSNGADQQFHYAIIQVETIQPTPTKNLILVTPVTTPNPSTTTK